MGSEAELRQEPTIVIYGGAFDPPHIGHRLVVARASELFPKSRMWISPSPSPAGAGQQHKTPGASYEQRVDMCRLNFADSIASGQVEISLLEAQLPAPNYTIRTLQHCAQSFANNRWALLIGLDQLEQFDRWRNPAEILALADVIVVSRNSESSLSDAVLRMGQKLGLVAELVDTHKMRWQKLSTFIYLLPGCVSDAASRDVRNDPNLALKKGWLAPELADYIQQHRIYTK